LRDGRIVKEERVAETAFPEFHTPHLPFLSVGAVAQVEPVPPGG
jgi:hypothetical protein